MNDTQNTICLQGPVLSGEHHRSPSFSFVLLLFYFLVVVLFFLKKNCFLFPPFSSPNYRFVDVDKLEFDVGGSRFVIRRLRKYTKYEIVVQAVNTFGEGPLSVPSIGQTQEDGKYT